jgi:hypothetical protein
MMKNIAEAEALYGEASLQMDCATHPSGDRQEQVHNGRRKLTAILQRQLRDFWRNRASILGIVLPKAPQAEAVQAALCSPQMTDKLIEECSQLIFVGIKALNSMYLAYLARPATICAP